MAATPPNRDTATGVDATSPRGEGAGAVPTTPAAPAGADTASPRGAGPPSEEGRGTPPPVQVAPDDDTSERGQPAKETNPEEQDGGAGKKNADADVDPDARKNVSPQEEDEPDKPGPPDGAVER